MSEKEQKLDFSLPERAAAGASKGAGAGKVLLFLVLLVGIANLAVTLLRKPPAAGAAVPAGGAGAFSVDSLKKLALKLEKQGLHAAAAAAWQDYLGASDLQDFEAAKIWYRIGTVYKDGGEHERALDAFYRSEGLHHSGELEAEIGRHTQESLEALGKFAALKHELAERVSIDKKSAVAGEDIVAEIGAQQISRGELDQQIEANIENQLAQYAAQMPEEDRRRQKEAMLNQFASDEQRLQFLNGYIVQEILYRKARESKLTDDPKVRAQLRDVERGLLAQQMMATELAGQINITESDLKDYYTANKAQYLKPESAAISQLLVADETVAADLIAQAKGGDAAKFAELAKEHSIDEATREKGGELPGSVSKSAKFVPGIGQSDEAVKAIFETAAGSVVETPFATDKGSHVLFVRERSAERQQPFEEVQREVYQALRSRKEREVQTKLMNQLRDEYNVVIHQSKFKSPATTEGEEPPK